MKIILVAVMSLDNFIADSNGDVTTWSSQDDKEFFADIRRRHRLFVMGRDTFDRLPKPLSKDPLRVVLTSEPRPDDTHLHFRSFSPEAFVEGYKQFDTCLLLGGSRVYEDFLRAGLVDEIYLTREPIELKSGVPLLQTTSLSQFVENAHLTKKPLNDTGTVLEHYILN